MAMPSFVAKLFWEIDPKKATPRKHPQYVINRVLDLGNGKAVSWLVKLFGREKIKQMLPKIKLSPKSKNYWKLVIK